MRTIVYLDDVVHMHQEWENRVGVGLRESGVDTVHCIGEIADPAKADDLQILSAMALLQGIASGDILPTLVVSDVHMRTRPVSGPRDWRSFGGLKLLSEIASCSSVKPLPVIFLSAQLESEAQESLVLQYEIAVVGEVLLQGAHADALHWRILGRMLSSFLGEV